MAKTTSGGTTEKLPESLADLRAAIDDKSKDTLCDFLATVKATLEAIEKEAKGAHLIKRAADAKRNVDLVLRACDAYSEPETETRTANLTCTLGLAQVDDINLELGHISALAGIAFAEADQSDPQIMTVLMLLRERASKVESLMQDAWEQSKQRAAA